MADILELFSKNQIKRNIPDVITSKIRSLVKNGTIIPDTQLPSETVLAESLGVSRTTLREALNILQQEGIVIRKHGIGTFVTKQPFLINRLDRNFGTIELIESMGYKSGISYLSLEIKPAGDYWASLLDIKENTSLLEIERVVTANEKPVLHTIDVIPKEYIRQTRGGLTIHKFRNLLQRGISIYKILEEDFGIRVSYGIAKIKPVQASTDIRQKMNIKKSKVMLFISQVDYDNDGRPLMAFHEHHLVDDYSFTLYRKRI